MAFCVKRLTVRGTFRLPTDYCCMKAKLGENTQKHPGFGIKWQEIFLIEGNLPEIGL